MGALKDLDDHKAVWAQAPDPAWLAGVEPVGRPNRGLKELIARESIDVDAVETVLEIGAELGGSTRRFLGLFPNAVVVSVDPWMPGYTLPPEWSHLRGRAAQHDNSLFSLFLGFNAPHSDRILPIRHISSDGLMRARELGLKPDIVYIDGDHTYHGVFTDLVLADAMFPLARIMGDDWNFTSSYARYQGIEYSVQKAVKDFVLHTGREVRVLDNNYLVPPRIGPKG